MLACKSKNADNKNGYYIMKIIKDSLRKNFVIIFALFALIGMGIAFAMLDRKAPPAHADVRTSAVCDGSHTDYTDLSASTVTLSSGKYYLTGDTKLDSNITIADNADVTICLNGYILSGTVERSVIAVGSGATLKICDCRAESADAEHKHYYTVDDTTGLWKFTDASGNFLTSGDENKYVVGGVITGGKYAFAANENDKSERYGGGILNNGNLEISGGIVAGNTGESGGVYISSGSTFTMSGGSIVGNLGIVDSTHSNTYGGVYVEDNTATVNISGKSVIDGNFGQYLDLDSFSVMTEKRNLYLNDGCRIATGKLQEGARLSLAVANFSGEAVVTVSYDRNNKGVDPNSYLFSDDSRYRFVIYYGEAQLSDKYGLVLNLYKNRSGEWVTDSEHTSYRYSETATPLPDAVRGGYSFSGWYTDDGFTGETVTEISAGSYGAKTFYAKWEVNAQNDLLGGDNIKFGKHNLWDCQRSPAFPLADGSFYIYGLSAPLDVKGRPIALDGSDYVKFLPYDGVPDADGNGIVTVSELGASDRNRIADTLYGSTYATSKQAILDSVVVSEVKYDGSGRAETLANIGLIWALGDVGFLYTALDPDCGWSYSGGVGTFITFAAHKQGDSIQYIPDSSDPLKNDDLIDNGGDKIIAVPTPETAEPTNNSYAIVGKVIDQNGDPINNALVFTGSTAYLDGEINVHTDANGHFAFDVLQKNIKPDNKTEINVSSNSPSWKTYEVALPTDGLVIIVYNTASIDKTEDDTISVSEIYKIVYVNVDGATPGSSFPLEYTRGVGAALSDPTKQCATFGGWYETSDFGGARVTEISREKSGDVTLYAKWEENHVWNDGVVTKAATCTVAGEKTFTCTVCGTTKPEAIAIDPDAHSYGEFAVTKAATCTETGEKTRVCSHNATHTERQEIPALGHSYGDWTLTRPATADGDGEEARVCSVCGETQTRAVSYVPGTGTDPEPDPEPKAQTKARSLLWLIILLAVILAAETVALILRIRAKKKNKESGKTSEKMNAFLPLLAGAYPMGETVAVAVLAASVVVMGIAIACTFIKKKDKEAAEKIADADENSDFEQPVSAEQGESETAEVAEEQPVGQDENDAEAQTLEAEIKEELESDKTEDSGISLRESLALAAANARIKIDKKSVAEWLENNYGGEVRINRRANKTKTGLPLADTHYVTVGAKKKCFIYVYELDEDKSMLLLKTDDDTAKEIEEKYPAFVRSRFPKARREKWYTLIPDGGFGSPDEVFDVIALVLSKYTENLRSVSEEVRKEIAMLEEVKKSNVTVEEAKGLVSDAAASALVTGKKRRKTGKKFAVNIDTLSDNYEPDDTVDMESLKEKGIVPKSVLQIKILARGTLDKTLTVVADDFSADAVKMIVLTGGEAFWS